ncbi:MAG: hypothetical protein IPL31_05895 [Saprospiraceae bacterium]|nr:hypothetical protein [Saprospiraceae bacterium]
MRVYDLRERIIGFLIALTNDKKHSNQIKSRDNKKREEAILIMKEKLPDIINTVVELFTLIDDDIHNRNDHTHSEFLNIMIVLPDQDIYDIKDFIQHIEEPSLKIDNKRIKRILKKEIHELSSNYCNKINMILEYEESFVICINNYSLR